MNKITAMKKFKVKLVEMFPEIIFYFFEELYGDYVNTKNNWKRVKGLQQQVLIETLRDCTWVTEEKYTNEILKSHLNLYACDLF